MKTAEAVFYTIGHSTRPFEEFLALLNGAGIERLIDVRTIPRSRRNPQYGTENLAKALDAAGIRYEHMPALGGLRKKQPGIDEETNAYWRNQSFHNYADYALSDEFRGALQRLRTLGHAKRCAIMCAEAHFSQCHRQIIADHLMGAGERVHHIVRKGEIVEGTLNPAAQIDAEGNVTYPGSVQASLFPGQEAP